MRFHPFALYTVHLDGSIIYVWRKYMSDISTRYDEDVPVLIVGGSVVGLSTALFLAWHGIPALLVERHATTSIHARAGGFNARTMEMFRQVGIESAIFAQETPPAQPGEMGLRVESLTGKVLDTTETTAHWQASTHQPIHESHADSDDWAG